MTEFLAGLSVVVVVGLAALFGFRHRIVYLWDRRPWRPIDRVPRSEGEKRRLLAARPVGWEYLLFAHVLLTGLAAHERKYLDHKARVTWASGLAVPIEEFAARVSEEIHRILMAIANWELLINGPSFEAAVGKRGEPGDPDRIEHLADGLTEAYVATMEWAARLRGAQADPEIRDAIDILSRYADQPIEQYRAFVADVVKRLDQLPRLLRDKNRVRPIAMEFELVLSVADDVSAEWDREYKRLMSLADSP